MSGAAYKVAEAKWMLRFSGEALAGMAQYVQRHWWSREAIGQLYTRDPIADEIIIDHVTALTRTIARWARVRFDTKEVDSERAVLFSDGLHCVGFWHTHPEPRPSPSLDDRRLARNHALAAQGQRVGLVFAILGNDPLPVGLRVWIDDGQKLHEALNTENGAR